MQKRTREICHVNNNTILLVIGLFSNCSVCLVLVCMFVSVCLLLVMMGASLAFMLLVLPVSN